MNVKLTPEQERIVKGALKGGRFRTPEEVIAEALAALKRQERIVVPQNAEDANATQEQAVRDMIAFAEENHVRLSGISVKELIHEGHRV